MLKRPKAGDTEEDLLEFQKQFLSQNAPLSVTVSRCGDKRKQEQTPDETANQADRDVVQMEGLPSHPPKADPPVKKSRFKAAQEKKGPVKGHGSAAAPGHTQDSEDPEEMLDKHDTHMAAVLTKIIERDTRNMAVHMPRYTSLAFPTVNQVHSSSNVVPTVTAGMGGAASGNPKKTSLFAREFAKNPAGFGVAVDPGTSGCHSQREQVETQAVKDDPPTIVEGTGLSATFGRDEAVKIHQENVNKMGALTEDEILAEQRKLLESLDPKLVEFLKTRKPQGEKEAPSVAMDTAGDFLPQKSKAKTPKTDTELPVEVDKDWVHMDKVEADKLQWMKDLPPPSTGHSKTGQQARFDFRGCLLAADTDVPVNVGLHHHGDEPERAGYTLEELFQLARSSNVQQRTLAIQTLGHVIQQAKEGNLAELIQTPILPSILDAGVMFLLRWALDDNVETVVMAAVATLNALLVNQADELSLDRVFPWHQGHRTPRHAPPTHEGPGIKLPDVDDEKGQETDADIAKQDLMLALVTRMSLLPRLRYILEVMRPQAPVVVQILQILVRVARHSSQLAYQVYTCHGLLDLIVTEFLPLSWTVQDVSEPLSNTYGVPVTMAMRLMKTLCRSGRNMAAQLVSKFGLGERLTRYLIETDFLKLQLPDGEAVKLQIASLHTWTVCLSYGVADTLYIDLYPVIVEQLQKHADVDMAGKLTALVRALESVVCVAATASQAARGFKHSQDGDSVEVERSEDVAMPAVNWSHVADLVQHVKLILKSLLTDIAETYQIKKPDLQLVTACLNFVTTYYVKWQSLGQTNSAETVKCLEDVEEIYTGCMKHWSSYGFKTIISNVSKHSNLLQPPEHKVTETSSCLPECGSSSVCEDQFLPVIRTGSPYGFLVAVFRMVYSFSKIHKGLTSLPDASLHPYVVLHCDDMWTYLRKISPWTPSHLSHNYFTKFENQLQYYFLKIATLPAHEEELLKLDRPVLHCVALTLLTDLHYGDEYLAHDLLSTVIFNPVFLRSKPEDSAATKLADLSLVTTPTHLQSATQKEITFTSGQLCREAESKLAGIRATYLYTLGHTERDVLKSRSHFLQNPMTTETCFTSNIGECMLPKDWMFMPLIELYNAFATIGSADQNVLSSAQLQTVCNVLRWIYLLEMTRSALLAAVPITLKISRIMCVFLTGNDMFLDRTVHCFLAGLLLHYARPSLLARMDFTEDIPGLTAFYDLYVGLLQQYEAVSFGDPLFACYVLLPLQMCHSVLYRRAVWTEYSGILRTLSISVQELLVPIERYMEPEERDVELLRLYYQSLFAGTLRPRWAPVLYLMAVHHVNRFMYTQDRAYTKLKRTMMTQVMICENEELKHHLTHYKTVDTSQPLGMTFYDHLPAIRQNFIDSLKVS